MHIFPCISSNDPADSDASDPPGNPISCARFLSKVHYCTLCVSALVSTHTKVHAQVQLFPSLHESLMHEYTPAVLIPSQLGRGFAVARISFRGMILYTCSAKVSFQMVLNVPLMNLCSKVCRAIRCNPEGETGGSGGEPYSGAALQVLRLVLLLQGTPGREEHCSAGGGVTRRPIFPTPRPPSLAAVTGGGFRAGVPDLPCPGGGGGGPNIYGSK